MAAIMAHALRHNGKANCAASVTPLFSIG